MLSEKTIKGRGEIIKRGESRRREDAFYPKMIIRKGEWGPALTLLMSFILNDVYVGKSLTLIKGYFIFFV